MLMVEAVRPPWLEAHRLKVLFNYTEYGAKCWPLLYQQESRWRSERLPWMLMRESDKADAAIEKNQHTSFDPKKPWGFLCELAASDEGCGAEGF